MRCYHFDDGQRDFSAGDVLLEGKYVLSYVESHEARGTVGPASM